MPHLEARVDSRRDEGQVSILVVLVVGLFLLGFVGFGVDMTNLFFHRQMAQNAADAACIAAGMDMLVNQTNGSSLGGGFIRGTPFDCNSNSGYSPCAYAALNGYSSPSATPLPGDIETNAVHVSFPASVPGAVVDATVAGANPFVQVDVYDGVRLYFSSLLSGGKTQIVHALAKCGLQNARAPVPIIVLDPTCPHSFEVSGSASVQIIGGPSKSIQVNSSNATCAAATQSGGCSGNGTIDLSLGGMNFTGSDFGVFGLPRGAPSNFNGGSSGVWRSPASPVADPWATLVPPTKPTIPAPAPVNVAHNVDGCPDVAGCLEYSEGLYTSPIIVKNITAIFKPGVYYITGTDKGNCGSPGTGCLAGNPTGQCRYGLEVDSNGIVRPSTAAGDGSGGTLFYLSGNGAGTYGSVFFGSNAGSRTVDPFPTTSLPCAGAPAPVTPPGKPLPTSFQGDILLGPCTGPGGVVPDPRGYAIRGADGNNYHGMLMWDDRSNADLNGQPSMQGGGGLLLAGNLYFHNCPEAPAACAPPPADYNAFLNLQGTPGSSTYVFGNITTDELIEGGNGTITMELNPNLVTNILKVALLQ